MCKCTCTHFLSLFACLCLVFTVSLCARYLMSCLYIFVYEYMHIYEKCVLWSEWEVGRWGRRWGGWRGRCGCHKVGHQTSASAPPPLMMDISNFPFYYYSIKLRCLFEGNVLFVTVMIWFISYIVSIRVCCYLPWLVNTAHITIPGNFLLCVGNQ